MDHTSAADTERIVFVTEDGAPTGETGPKLASHHERTRLHLAFSCYLFRRRDNAFLITRRGLEKKVWPGVWTNSVCGHPVPGEVLEDAVRRRAAFELGLPELTGLRCVVPRYVYQTPPFNGIVEHEFCPIFTATVDEDPVPDPGEVDDFRWLDWGDYGRLLEQDEQSMSYWAKDQYALLSDLEPFASLRADTSASDQSESA
jgi:isopentenyl-diphosphate delta-isomerase